MTRKGDTTYTPAIGAEICDRLSSGESLLSITKDLGIPYKTAYNWETQIPEHGANSARAREIGCHAIAEDCVKIADTPEIGVERTIKADGTEETREGDMIQHRRLRVDTRMRLLGKWLPKVYGDKTQLEHSGTVSIADVLREARERRRGEG